MKISKDFHFSMAHRLPNHAGLCKNIHGHTYKVRLTFVGSNNLEDESTGNADEGMVVDFSDIKTIASPLFDDELDHGCMLCGKYDKDIIQFLRAKGLRVIDVDFVPTAENMAEWIYNALEGLFKDRGINLRKVTVWETPTSSAEYKKV